MNKLDFDFGSKFKRDLKKHFTILVSQEWTEIAHCLLNNLPLADKYQDHQLTGNFKDYRECHIRPDLLLIYAERNGRIHLSRIGTHSELFG